MFSIHATGGSNTSPNLIAEACGWNFLKDTPPLVAEIAHIEVVPFIVEIRATECKLAMVQASYMGCSYCAFLFCSRQARATLQLCTG